MIKFRKIKVIQYTDATTKWDSCECWPENQILVSGRSSTLDAACSFNLDMTADLMAVADKATPDMSTIKKVFRFPNLALSQDKMSLVKEKYGTKITRKREEADLWVISAKYLSKLSKYEWHVSFMSQETALVYLSTYEHLFTDDVLKKMIDTITGLDEGTFIALDVPNWGLENADMQSSTDFIADNSEGVTQPYTMFQSEYQLLEDLKNNQDKLISDVAMNDITSEDSIALTSEHVKTIKTMLKSNNDDKAVGMSLMANCKLKESHTWLGFIFFDCTTEMKGTRMWNQVAFKTLKAKFEKYIDHGHRWGSTGASHVNSLTSFLYEDDALTKEAIEILKDRMFKSVEQHMGEQLNIHYKFNREDIKLVAKRKKNTEEGVEALV